MAIYIYMYIHIHNPQKYKKITSTTFAKYTYIQVHRQQKRSLVGVFIQSFSVLNITTPLFTIFLTHPYYYNTLTTILKTPNQTAKMFHMTTQASGFSSLNAVVYLTSQGLARAREEYTGSSTTFRTYPGGAFLSYAPGA